MNAFTLDDLRTIMRESAGELEIDALTVDVANTCYVDLGYDSLALLEVTARIKQTLNVAVPDAALVCSATPAATVTAVNLVLSERTERGDHVERVA